MDIRPVIRPPWALRLFIYPFHSASLFDSGWGADTPDDDSEGWAEFLLLFALSDAKRRHLRDGNGVRAGQINSHWY